MLKKIIFFTLFVLVIPNQIVAQFSDDFERYNYLQRVSTQSFNWITWSEDPNLGTGYIIDEDGIISNTDYPTFGESQHLSYSGKQAMFIGKSSLGNQPQDVVLDLHNKSIGSWNLTWKMYIPKKKRAYYNFQEDTPIKGIGNWAIQVYFNKNGNGKIMNDSGNTIVNFSYPNDEWFELKHLIDLDDDNISIEIISSSGITVIYNANFLSNTQHLGGVNFYSVSKKNKYYIDDVVFEKTSPIKDVYIWSNNHWEDRNGSILSGEPNSSYEVILREPFIVGTSTSAKVLNCLDLVFEDSGNLTIPAQMNVVVSGNLKVPTNNRIIVDDGGSFIMSYNNASIDMPDPNSFEYTRISNEMTNAYDFTYWSTPVEGAYVSNFGSPAVYTYKTANYIDLYSGKGYPQTTGSPDRHDDNGDDWSYTNNSDNLIFGKGYAVLSPGITPNQSISFTGKPNNGYISIPVELSGNDSNVDDDWNLLGNPYPSAIDASLLINSNINISGTLYFWTHNTALGGGNNDGPSSSNYNTNDYATFNLSGGTAAGTGGEIPNGYIASGQGFFMEVNNTGEVTFNNDMRIINAIDENTQFFKSPNDKIINNGNDLISENRIWLSLSNDKGAFSQSLIAFLPGATDGYEGNYDGIRAGTDLGSKFYSILDDRELAIQGRSIWSENVQIPFGFFVSKPDSFIISIDKLEGLEIEKNIVVYLVDHELNKIHNLKQTDYQFIVRESGANNQRFTIQFMKTSTLNIESVTIKEDIIVTSINHDLKVSANQIVKSAKIYDLLGRMLIDSKPNKQKFYLNTSNIKKGTVLIVNALLENGSIISKKIIKL